MNIRNMTVQDYLEVDQLMQQLNKLHVKGRPDLYVDLQHPYSLENFRQKVESAEHILLLAEENGKILGICFVAMRERSMMVNQQTAYMDDLFVCEEVRRQGIATKLFKDAEKKAVALGAKRLDLMVWDFNQSAIGFYKSLGMTEQRYIFEKEL